MTTTTEVPARFARRLGGPTEKTLRAIAICVLAGAPVAHAADAGRCVAVGPDECLYVTTRGAGADVVLIPGLFGTAYSFRQVLPLLSAAGYRATVVEPLGVGLSSRPKKADYSLTAQAERAIRVLDAMGISRAIVVSHSVGTAVALRAAADEPGRIRGVLSLEGGPVENVATPGFRRALKLAPLLKLLGPGVLRGRIRSMLASRSANPGWVTDEVVARYAEGPSRDFGATLSALSAMAKATEPEPLSARLPDVSCPVRLVLGGTPHEGRPGEAEVDALRRLLPRFSVRVVPGAGNYLFEESPRMFLEILEEFAAELPSPSNGARS